MRSVTEQYILIIDMESTRVHLQPTLALSNTEAEYVAANESGKTTLSLIQIRNIFNPYCDPMACVPIHSVEPTPLEMTQDTTGNKRKFDTQLIH